MITSNWLERMIRDQDEVFTVAEQMAKRSGSQNMGNQLQLTTPNVFSTEAFNLAVGKGRGFQMGNLEGDLLGYLHNPDSSHMIAVYSNADQDKVKAYVKENTKLPEIRFHELTLFRHMLPYDYPIIVYPTNMTKYFPGINKPGNLNKLGALYNLIKREAPDSMTVWACPLLHPWNAALIAMTVFVLDEGEVFLLASSGLVGCDDFKHLSEFTKARTSACTIEKALKNGLGEEGFGILQDKLFHAFIEAGADRMVNELQEWGQKMKENIEVSD